MALYNRFFSIFSKRCLSYFYFTRERFFIKNIVRLYIFISTNSLYDNCLSIYVKDHLIKEDEAIRPKLKAKIMLILK